MTIDDIITDRTNKHGEFEENARVTWAIMDAMMKERNWPLLPPGKRHALYMIAQKMGRIIAGDPGYDDHWNDIQGYAKCVSDRIHKPAETYQINDPANAYAAAWNCSPDEARRRIQQILDDRNKGVGGEPTGALDAASAPTSADPSTLPGARPRRVNTGVKPRPEPTAPGSPDDGGHHAQSSDFFTDEELENSFKDDKEE